MPTAKIHCLADYRPITRRAAADSGMSLATEVARSGFDIERAFVKFWYPSLVRRPRDRPIDRRNLRDYKKQ
jgi:hypothetical protein